MSNRLYAAVLIGGLGSCVVPYSLLANNPYGTMEPSRYQFADISAHAAYDFAAAPHTSSQVTPYQQAQQFASSASDCDDAAYLDSSCIVNQPETRHGLYSQLEHLQRYPLQRRFANNGFNLSGYQLKTTVEGVLNWLDQEQALIDQFELIDISHYHSLETKFTGYYTPVIAASRYYSSEYPYPVYRAPLDGRKNLTRAEIDRGALTGSGLEIAWVKDPVDLFYLHLQGSGILRFSDGTSKALEYEGTNGQTFQSIAKYMQRRGYLKHDLSRRAISNYLRQHPEKTYEVLGANPRYVYFRMKDQMAATASGIKPIPGHTVAVDTSFIPFGAVLLAEVPTVDSLGRPAGYQWRMLFPQDRGNAIKGQARIDLYTGKGELARQWANHVTGFRRAFMLLDKKSSLMQTASINR